MGEEIYYVRVATAHTAHACAGLPKQIPPGQTRSARHTICTHWESHLRSTADKDGKRHEAKRDECGSDSTLTPPVGPHPTGRAYPGSEGVQVDYQ